MNSGNTIKDHTTDINKCIEKCTCDMSNDINKCLIVHHLLNYKSIPGNNPCFIRLQTNNKLCIEKCQNS